MKFTEVSQPKNKVKLSLVIIFMFLLNGCVIPTNQTKSRLQCIEAERAVSQAENEYDDASYELFKGQKEENTINNFLVKMQSLGDAQEKAFQACNPVTDS